jgi:hypothetical protein
MKKTVLSVLAVVGMAGSAFAAPLPLGGSVLTAGLTNTAPPGSQIDFMVQSFSASNSTNNIAGTVESWVFDNVGVGYVFAYRVNVTTANTRVIRSSVSGLWNLVDIGNVGYQTGGVVPVSMDHPSPNSVGANFTFASGLGAGASSAIFWFQTDVFTYTRATVQIIDGIVAETTGFAPIPLPSAGLMGLAGLGLVGIRRRR